MIIARFNSKVYVHVPQPLTVTFYLHVCTVKRCETHGAELVRTNFSRFEGN